MNANDFVGLSDEEKTLKIAFKGANPSDLPLIPTFQIGLMAMNTFLFTRGLKFLTRYKVMMQSRESARRLMK